MANIRVKDLPNTSAPAADTDEFIIDSSSAGTRRLNYGELKTAISGDFQSGTSTYKVATLGSDNKLDPAQIPDTLSQGLNFVGVANSAGDLTSTTQGDFYVIQTAFGSYNVGDQAVYDGSTYVRVVDGTKEISEGGTGATTLDDAKNNLEIIDIGTGPSQVPLNQHLGTMAYQDIAGVSVDTLEVTGQVTGNLGIGTTSPDQLIHASSSTGASLRLERDSVTITSGQSYGAVEWEGQDASGGGAASGVRAKIETEATGSSGDVALKFYTAAANDVATERVRIDSSGRALIGSTSAYSTDTKVEIKDDNPKLVIHRGGARAYGLTVDGTSLAIRDESDNATRVTIDSSGRVGIGGSPGSYFSGTDDLVVAGTSGDHGVTIATPNTANGGLMFADSDSTTIGRIQYSHGTNEMKFRVNNTEVWSINSSGNLVANSTGIDFGSVAEGSGTPVANGGLLDDYESGSLTATLTPSGSGTITVDSSTNTLRYVKVGNLVSVTGKIAVSAVSSPVGSYVYLNLPFTVGSATGNRTAGTVLISAAASNANTYGVFVPNAGSTAYICSTAGTSLGAGTTGQDFSGNEELHINISYIAA